MFYKFNRRIMVVMSSWLLTAVALLAFFALLRQPAQAATYVAPSHWATVRGPLTPTVYLPLVMTPPETCYYVETDDAVVIEMESIPVVEAWVLDTSFPGYTGNGYYVWTGPQYWDISQAGHGILSYPISLTKSATYRLNIRNTHTGDPTLSNDIWVRLDDGPWTKAFSHITNQWNYFLQFDFQNGQPHDWVDFPNLQPGLHVLDISARSSGFWLDRLVFSANGMGQLDDWPESPCLVP